MIKIISTFLDNPIEAYYFFIPILSSFLIWKMRKKINREKPLNLLWGFFYIIGTCIDGVFFLLVLVSILINFGLIISISLIPILLYITILTSIIFSSLDRQYILLNNLIIISRKEELSQMSNSVEEISNTARQEIWMFCGSLSFFEREKNNLSKLLETCNIKAICKDSNKKKVIKRYKRAREIGIEVRTYSKNSYDKGIRGRIIDPKNNLNSCAILIEKTARENQKVGKKEISYSTYLLDCSNNAIELNLLTDVFEIIWDISS